MAKPGRANQYDKILPIDSTRAGSRLIPPAFLKSDERSMFMALAAQDRHLTRTDEPLLATYVQAIGKTSRLAQHKDVGPWERAARVLIALARSLRLTPQSTTDPQAIGRRRTRPNCTMRFATAG
jgi:hypothetical protein